MQYTEIHTHIDEHPPGQTRPEQTRLGRGMQHVYGDAAAAAK